MFTWSELGGVNTLAESSALIIWSPLLPLTTGKRVDVRSSGVCFQSFESDSEVFARSITKHFFNFLVKVKVKRRKETEI